MCLFSLCLFFSSSSVTLCPLSCVLRMSATQTDVCFGHISLLSDVLCYPVVGDPLFNHGRTILQASSLPLVSVHNSLHGRTSQSGATAGLSHSCSGLDLSPFTYDLSRCGKLPVRGAERDITAKNHEDKSDQLSRSGHFSGPRLKRLLVWQTAVDYYQSGEHTASVTLLIAYMYPF